RHSDEGDRLQRQAAARPGRQQPLLQHQRDHARRRRVARRDHRYHRRSGGHVLPLHAQPRSPVERRRELRRADDRSSGQLGRAAMNSLKMATAISTCRILSLLATAATLLLAAGANAAAPGITGPAFNLTAREAYISQPDGQMVYSWGYGCNPNIPPTGYAPAAVTGAKCGTMQIPGPTLIVTEGQTVSVTLTNNLPTSAGNT